MAEDRMPGNANLPIGNLKTEEEANQEMGIPGVGKEEDANQEIGVPGVGKEEDANREIGVPGVGTEEEANQEIGVPGVGTEEEANREIGVPGVGKEEEANQEIGVPGVGKEEEANQEIGVPGVGDEFWHTRGYLPHAEGAALTEHVTFHLGDSIPREILAGLAVELESLPENHRSITRRKRIAGWLDAGYGACLFRDAEIARMMQDTLLYFHGQRYCIHAWVIMPNHVHVLFRPLGTWTVAKIVASWKKFSARRISEFQHSVDKSPVWHREYWDRYIRDYDHYEQVVTYIEQNPVKAGLVLAAGEWPWSSAYPDNLGVMKSVDEKGA